ncbi:MAG: FkbM family methyltransferase [Patescibacteria group bacterium]
MAAKYPARFLIGNLIYRKFYFVYRPLYLFYKNISDRKKIRVLKKIIKPGMVVVDIGANIGFYSALFSKLVGAAGKVYAFEPDEDNFRHLEKNMRGLKNVSINKIAVSDKSGKIRLYISDVLNIDHHTYDNGENRKSVEIDAITLDDFFSNNEIVDFIKIDIQGYDYYAILGGKKLINRTEQLNILSEFWPYGLNKAGIKPLAYIELLKNLNFQIDLPEEKLKDIDSKINDNMFSLDFFANKI